MTPTKLNRRAAEICGLTFEISEDGEPWYVLHDGSMDWFRPSINPADCAVLMEAMEKKGWCIESDGPFGDCYTCIVYRPKALGQAFKENGPTRWHAITIAAVRAVGGEQ